MPVTIGLFGANLHAASEPRGAEAVARRAEELGYDSLWVAEHAVLPSPRVPPSPMEPTERILDPVVALAHLAAVTERVRLGTGVLVLPQRNPVLLAKELASVDVLSGGRLIAGVGAGYLEPELRALGVSLERRGARTDDYLRALLTLWYDEKPAWDGEFVRVDGVDAHPRPVQRPVPLLIGGHSPPALRRALRFGDEWYGFRLDVRRAAEQLASLPELADGADRDGRAPLRINITPRGQTLDSDTVRAYADLGVHRIIVRPPVNATLDELLAFVEAHAPARLGARPRDP
jgi:probable F420-dependent oxidoreductase